MQITGIVCEYNPFHLGHSKQIRMLKEQGHTVVCLMSGNFVQRGHPAIFDKMRRAKAALACGADLVLELPVTYALSSAEGFADGAVRILSKLCDHICFGAETADTDRLMAAAELLLSPAFSEKLRIHLDSGTSFPAARAAALADCGMDAEMLTTPNNILAVEYCKAILSQGSSLSPIAIHRPGSYHDLAADAENPSATAIRRLFKAGQNWRPYIPTEAVSVFEQAPIHTLELGEKAILYRLRTMNDEEFQALPFGSEGLWRKLMHASREHTELEGIIAATKSKRYTRTRIDRMILCAFLGITEQIRTSAPPHCRVLGFREAGRELLRYNKEGGEFINIGEKTGTPYEALEQRVTSLYGLFARQPELPQQERQYRVIYHKNGDLPIFPRKTDQ